MMLYFMQGKINVSIRQLKRPFAKEGILIRIIKSLIDMERSSKLIKNIVHELKWDALLHQIVVLLALYQEIINISIFPMGSYRLCGKWWNEFKLEQKSCDLFFQCQNTWMRDRDNETHPPSHWFVLLMKKIVFECCGADYLWI